MSNYSLTAIIDSNIFNNLDEFSDELSLCHALEIRYDLFSDQSIWPELSSIIRKKFPMMELIGTIRFESDGGSYPNKLNEQRLELWQQILHDSHKLNWVDIECEYFEDIMMINNFSKNKPVKIILSKHNFNKMTCESDLEFMVNTARQMNTDGLKLATTAKSEKDEFTLYSLILNHSRDFLNFSFFSMTKEYQRTRVLSALICDSHSFVYGYLDKACAPGQFKISQLNKILDNAQIKHPEGYEALDDYVLDDLNNTIKEFS